MIIATSFPLPLFSSSSLSSLLTLRNKRAFRLWKKGSRPRLRKKRRREKEEENDARGALNRVKSLLSTFPGSSFSFPFLRKEGKGKKKLDESFSFSLNSNSIRCRWAATLFRHTTFSSLEMRPFHYQKNHTILLNNSSPLPKLFVGAQPTTFSSILFQFHSRVTSR